MLTPRAPVKHQLVSASAPRGIRTELREFMTDSLGVAEWDYRYQF